MRQPPLLGPFDVPFNGRSESVTGDIWCDNADPAQVRPLKPAKPSTQSMFAPGTFICTERYTVGRYKFTGFLPTVGTSNDQKRWRACVDGQQLPAMFDTLEAAMIAAVKEGVTNAAVAV